MDLKKEIFGVWILFTLKGRLDAQTAPDFDKEVLPEIDKHTFFADVERLGVLPRKTFSMGEADEKRFYMEAKRI